MRYDEGEHIPLLLHCGHGFCKYCLSKMFLASINTSLACPRCRHPTVVGNSVLALRKNFPVLSLLSSSPSSPSFEYDLTDEEDEENDDLDQFELNERRQWRDDSESELDFFDSHRHRRSNKSRRAISGRCTGGSRDSGTAIDLGVHHNVKLVKKIGEGRRPGLEVWTAVISGNSSSSSASSSSPPVKCRHRFAVKKVEISENMDVGWIQSKLEILRRASMWCRNVCKFHGAIRMDNSLCLILDRYNGSIQSEMLQNKGRLTLEQILRSDFYFLSRSILLMNLFLNEKQ